MPRGPLCPSARRAAAHNARSPQRLRWKAFAGQDSATRNTPHDFEKGGPTIYEISIGYKTVTRATKDISGTAVKSSLNALQQ